MKYDVEEGKAGTVLPRIVRAAVKLFVAKGIDGTTTRDIAAEARVSEGALYRHFKSKNELAWTIFSTHVNRFSMELTARVSGESSFKSKIRSYISTCFESFEENPDLFTYLIISEHRELSKFPSTHVHPGNVAWDLMKEGQRAGALRPMDYFTAGSLLFGAVHRLCLVRSYGAVEEDLRTKTDDLAEGLWNALKK